VTYLLRLAALGLVPVLLAGCGGSTDRAAKKEPEKAVLGKAADTQTCVARAKPAASIPAGYPRNFPLPQGAVLFNIEDRAADGTIGTAVVKSSLKSSLSVLNGPAQDAGFKITEGETEKHDAEANWTGNGFRGRWAIRESASCPGEVVIQVLAKKQ
jgi:hypothetical protein